MQPTVPRDLLKVDPKSKELYARFSLPHLTAYSVHWLTLWDIPSTYENISVLNARLFPVAFALSGFPEMPDAMRTNRTLLQMRPKYRDFATSDPRKGVYLTEKGRREIKRVIEVLGEPTLEGKPVESPVAELEDRRPGGGRTRNPAHTIKECRSRLLFQLFKEGQLAEADPVHFLGLVGLYDHTPPSEVRKDFRRLRADAADVQDQEFIRFLDAVAERFRDYLNRPDPAKKKGQ